MTTKKLCDHPQESLLPGTFLEGSFMTLGPRPVRHVIDWCEECGAIRFRGRTEDLWSEWHVPKRQKGVRR